MDIKKLKSRLDNNEIIELHNGVDLAQIGKSKITKDYLFIFNAQVLFGYKSFHTFTNKADQKIKQYLLQEVIGCV